MMVIALLTLQTIKLNEEHKRKKKRKRVEKKEKSKRTRVHMVISDWAVSDSVL